eukprot:284001-Amphidinium_carterae.1
MTQKRLKNRVPGRHNNGINISQYAVASEHSEVDQSRQKGSAKFEKICSKFQGLRVLHPVPKACLSSLPKNNSWDRNDYNRN